MCGPWARGAPQNLGVSFNISATTIASNFKFGTQLGFAKTHQRITPGGKSGRGLRIVELPKFWSSPKIFPQRLKLATSNLARSWRLPRAIIKSHSEKSGCGSKLGS